MSCEVTRQSLSLYVDDGVSLPVRAEIDEHLDRCPVCRAEVAELRSLTRSLALLSRPTPPANLVASISNALYIEAAARRQEPKPSPAYRVLDFLRPRLMPYTVGWCASVILFFSTFAGLRPHFVALREAGFDLNKPVTAEFLARERAPFGVQSPTLNPRGSLAALSGVSDYDPDDDMVVATDVFINGTASLAEVIRPPRDKRMLDEFESALRKDPAFVKASLDSRPDTMRVLFWYRGGAVEKVEVDINGDEGRN